MNDEKKIYTNYNDQYLQSIEELKNEHAKSQVLNIFIDFEVNNKKYLKNYVHNNFRMN